MNTSQATTAAAPVPRAFKRHDLHAVLPAVCRRVHAAEFTSQTDMAKAYGIDKATATRWKKRALSMGLTDHRAWRCGLLLGHMNRALAA